MYQLAARFLSVSLVWAAFGCIAQQLAWICTFRETEEDWWTSFYALCRLNFYNQAHNKGRWLISSTRSSPGRPLIQAAWESPHSSHPCYKQCYFSPPHLIQPTKRTKPSYQELAFWHLDWCRQFSQCVCLNNSSNAQCMNIYPLEECLFLSRWNIEKMPW